MPEGEVRPGADGAERETRPQGQTPEVARVVAAAADPTLLDPDRVIGEAEINAAMSRKDVDLKPLVDASIDSRKQYAKEQPSYEAHLTSWENCTRNWIEEHDSEVLQEVLSALDLQTTDGRSRERVLYDTYLEPDPKASVEASLGQGMDRFLDTLINGCMEGGKLNEEKLDRWLEAIGEGQLVASFGMEFTDKSGKRQGEAQVSRRMKAYAKARGLFRLPEEQRQQRKEALIQAAQQPLGEDETRSFVALAPQESGRATVPDAGPSGPVPDAGAKKEVEQLRFEMRGASEADALEAAKKDDREAIDAVLQNIDASITSRILTAKLPKNAEMRGVDLTVGRNKKSDNGGEDYKLYSTCPFAAAEKKLLLSSYIKAYLKQEWGDNLATDRRKLYEETMIFLLTPDVNEKDTSLITMFVPHALMDSGGRPAWYMTLAFDLPTAQANLLSEMIQVNPDVVEYFYEIVGKELDTSAMRYKTTGALIIDDFGSVAATVDEKSKPPAGYSSATPALDAIARRDGAFKTLLREGKWRFPRIRRFLHGPYGGSAEPGKFSHVNN